MQGSRAGRAKGGRYLKAVGEPVACVQGTRREFCKVHTVSLRCHI